MVTSVCPALGLRKTPAAWPGAETPFDLIRALGPTPEPNALDAPATALATDFAARTQKQQVAVFSSRVFVSDPGREDGVDPLVYARTAEAKTKADIPSVRGFFARLFSRRRRAHGRVHPLGSKAEGKGGAPQQPAVPWGSPSGPRPQCPPAPSSPDPSAAPHT